MNRTLALAAYIGSIVLANWLTVTYGLVPIGFGLLVTAGTFAAGFALVARDWVQTTAGRVLLFAAILVGAAISYFTSSPALALASGLAFLVSELVDTGVFTPLRGKSLPKAVLLSSIVSAPVDTVLFLWIAGFPLTWQAVLGQFIVKTAIAAVVALGLSLRARQVAAA
jgi:queuosine precursor transporter